MGPPRAPGVVAREPLHVALNDCRLVSVLALGEQDRRVAPPHLDLLVPLKRHRPADEHERHGRVVNLHDLLRLHEVGHVTVGVGAAAHEARAQAAAVAPADEGDGDTAAGDYAL